MRWGYIPSWATDPSDLPLLFNARAETLAEKPAFRGALDHRRCIVPADGFFEWQKVPGGKRPLFFHHRDRSPLSLAGIWSSYTTPDGTQGLSCAILTGPPNALLRPIHDRMPIILPHDAHMRWLDPNVPGREVQDLLAPYPAEAMAMYAVTERVGSPSFDEPAAVQPSEQRTLF
jgi:putative SOS response-associated peptidase YedK